MKTLKRLLLIVLIITSNNIFAQDEGIPCNTGYTSVTAGGGTYASEVSWTISDCDGNLLAEGGVPYADCLNVPDNAIVNMVDSYGDGWNGNVLTIGDNVFELANGSSGEGFIGACEENETFCDGEWVEETTTYNCSSLNDGVACESIDGCSWEWSWGGWGDNGGNGSSYCVGSGTTTNLYCDGEMVLSILGCTDESALNYDTNANQDDGSCILCDGELEESTNVYNCSSFSNFTSCENIEECSWESSWNVGDSYGGSFSNACVGGEGLSLIHI